MVVQAWIEPILHWRGVSVRREERKGREAFIGIIQYHHLFDYCSAAFYSAKLLVRY